MRAIGAQLKEPEAHSVGMHKPNRNARESKKRTVCAVDKDWLILRSLSTCPLHCRLDLPGLGGPGVPSPNAEV